MALISPLLILISVAILCTILGIISFINKEKRRSLISFIIATAFVAAAILSVLLIEMNQGDWRVTITIDYYQEDGTFMGDPCFQIWIAYMDEDTILVDETFTSTVFSGSMELEAPFEATVELPENVISLSYTIKVFNGSPVNNQIIDCDSGTGYFISRTLAPPFDGTWTSDGSDDGFEDIDCVLSYSVSHLHTDH